MIEESGQRDDGALLDAEFGVLLDVGLLLPFDRYGHVGAHRVAPLDRPVDGVEGGEAPAQGGERLLHLLRRYFRLDAWRAQRPIVAQIDRRPHGHGGVHDQRLQRFQLDLRLADGFDGFGLNHLVVEIGEHLVERLLDQRRTPDGALHDVARRLARAESGDADFLRNAAHGLVHGRLEAILFDLDFEGDKRPRQALCRNFHRRNPLQYYAPSIAPGRCRAAAGERPPTSPSDPVRRRSTHRQRG